jgi:hypothetical protein
MPKIRSPKPPASVNQDPKPLMDPAFWLLGLILVLAIAGAGINLFAYLQADPEPIDKSSQTAPPGKNTTPEGLEAGHYRPQDSLDEPSDSHIKDAKTIPQERRTSIQPIPSIGDLSHQPKDAKPSETSPTAEAKTGKRDSQALPGPAPSQPPTDTKPPRFEASGFPAEIKPPSPGKKSARQPIEIQKEMAQPKSTAKAKTSDPLPDPASLLRQGKFRQAAEHFQNTFQTNQRSFTIRLEVACQPETLQRGLKQAGFNPALFLLPRKIGARDCIALFWGRYDNATAAQKTLAALPVYFKEQKSPPQVVRLAPYLDSKSKIRTED